MRLRYSSPNMYFTFYTVQDSSNIRSIAFVHVNFRCLISPIQTEETNENHPVMVRESKRRNLLPSLERHGVVICHRHRHRPCQHPPPMLGC
jgi:hypothetical protein